MTPAAVLAGLVGAAFLVPPASAQDAAPPPPAFVASFRYAPLRVPRHPALAPGGRLGSWMPPALVAAAWERDLRATLAARPKTTSADTLVVAAEPPPPPPPPPARRVDPSLFGPYADLGMDLSLRFEVRADQFRNLQCTSLDRLSPYSGCDAGFPTLGINPQYAIRTAGIVGRRLHLDVDFDSEREFDANNNLQVRYEGLEDEVLRRVEAGNVTFRTPPSRFITAGVPANNFGVQAVAQLGALELRGIYAQQKGNIVKDRVYAIGDVTSQPLDREARDLDVELGRFFFAIDPVALPGFPAVDALGLDGLAPPDSLRVASLRVYRVRAVTPISGGNQSIGGIYAVACSVGAAGSVDCGAQRAGPFQWEVLQETRDYYVDPSGAWLALGSRLDQADYLAVSYVTAAGDSVGTFPAAADVDTTVVDTVRLVYDPRPSVTASSATFRFEMRNAYRIGGADVTRESVELALTVNQRERTLSTDETYLASLGLAVESDANRFDQYNRLFPRNRDPQQGAPLRDYFVIFPHLRPFADTVRLLPPERNDSLYRTPRSLLATQGPPSVFALRTRATIAASADRSLLSLNSFQIREGSERIYVGDALLTRDVDYTIDYAVGQVQFRNADSLFQGGAAVIRAQFEERAAFTIAPTSIYGVAARYDLGARGELNFTGMFQREQSGFTRPPLGFEPASSFIGGVSGQLRFEPAWITRLVDLLPGVRTDAPSFLNVSGEVAASLPRPNQLGQAYIEEFEDEPGRFLPLGETAWHWGSLPCGDPATACAEGALGATAFGVSPGGFDTLDVAALTWQSIPLSSSGPVQFKPQQIDPTIVTTGQAQGAEPVLWLMLKPDTVLGLANVNTGVPNWVRPSRGTPRWRSITQTLSATGVDLSRTEFLEFWVWEDNLRTAKANRAAILFDFGSIFEDAIAIAPDSFSVSGSDTTYHGLRFVGRGRLDTERDPRTQSWSATINDEGMLTDRVVEGISDPTGATLDTLPLCSAAVQNQLISYYFGDLRSRCGRRNGAVDTEDQDGDFRLDSEVGVRRREDFVRYVFPIGDERFFVRDGGMVAVADSLGGGASGWRLYRLSFRADTLQIGLPNLRQVQAVRLTVVAPETAPLGTPDPQIYFGLSRVRLLGSAWLKRAETPIPGVAGDRGTGLGEVVASTVSTDDRDVGYTSPPGVTDQPERAGADLQLTSTQINERSLRLLARGLRRGERAEAFLRFSAEGDKNFLRYRTLRAWARGRGPGWEDRDLEFYLKVGKDPDNFYLYRAPARTTSWEPEVVIDLNRWLALRATIEQAWLSGAPPQVLAGCPDSTLAPADSSYVACDGAYLVHVRDPGTAPPNLASVQEIAAGIFRVDERVFVDQAELWVDDIRLSDVVQDAGYAGAVDVSLTAANVFDVALSLSRRDGQFRQLDEDPRFVTDDVLSVGGTARLDRFLPAGWGLVAPLTVRYVETESAPFYLSGTDVRADALTGLRTPRSTAVSYALSLRRARRSTGRLGRWLLDPVALSGSYSSGGVRSELATATAVNYGVNLDYALAPNAANVTLAGLRLRVNPRTIRLRSSLSHAEGERTVFPVPIARAADSLRLPARSLGRFWRNSASVDLAPTGVLQLRFDVASARDLRDYGDSTTMGLIAEQERKTLFGWDIGFERQRTVGTLLSVIPRGPAWLRPRGTVSSSFSLARDPDARRPVRDQGDTAGAFYLPASFSNGQRLDLGAQLDLAGVGRRLLPDSGAVARLLGRITPIDLSVSRTVNSVYSQMPFTPSLGYQLALGGLEGLRSEGGYLATSASRNVNLAAASGVILPPRLRFSLGYQQGQGLTWVLRNAVQVPIRTRATDWPSLSGSWSFTPPAPVSRILTSLTAQAGYRERETSSEQPSLGGGATVFRSTDENFTPSLSLTWRGGVLTSFDASTSQSRQLVAGNEFRNERGQRNASLTFSFPSPLHLTRTRADVRTTARYGVTQQTTCLQSAGRTACVPYVDSRHREAQLTLDSNMSPNLSAGFQMAYIVNEERQANRKVAQLLITAFVSLNARVGQLR